MKKLWIGVVEVLTEPSSGDGNTRAFTNVVTWANSAARYGTAVTEVFLKYGWTVLGVENARPVDSETDFNEEIAEIIERARTNPNACIFATFHYYPSKPS
jgi:predicted TIM-barrel enzyme